MHINIEDIITFLISFFGGGGIGYTAVRLFMKNEAKEAVKSDFDDLKDEIKEIKEEYVNCKYCNMQHTNLDGMLKSMNSKLDILINKA